MERDRVNFCLWFMWARRVWDVNRGEVHWASELVQSGFWHVRAVHTNFNRLPVIWQSLRARGDCVFAVNILSDPFVCASCDVTCTDSDKQRSLIPLKSRQKSNLRPVRTSQPFFVSASSVFCLTGSLLRCWLCDISEGGFLLCLIHLSVLPSVWQVLNYSGEHKGPHPTHLIYLHRSTLAGWVQRKHFICVKQDISPSQKLLHCSLIFPQYCADVLCGVYSFFQIELDTL